MKIQKTLKKHHIKPQIQIKIIQITDIENIYCQRSDVIYKTSRTDQEEAIWPVYVCAWSEWWHTGDGKLPVSGHIVHWDRKGWRHHRRRPWHPPSPHPQSPPSSYSLTTSPHQPRCLGGIQKSPKPKKKLNIGCELAQYHPKESVWNHPDLTPLTDHLTSKKLYKNSFNLSD